MKHLLLLIPSQSTVFRQHQSFPSQDETSSATFKGGNEALTLMNVVRLAQTMLRCCYGCEKGLQMLPRINTQLDSQYNSLDENLRGSSFSLSGDVLLRGRILIRERISTKQTFIRVLEVI